MKESTFNVTYVVLRSYRDVLGLFRANGHVSHELLSMISVDSVLELRAAQPEGHILRSESEKPVSNEVALTLTALSILHKVFPEDQQIWRYIEQKAIFEIIKGNPSLNQSEVEEAIETIEPHFVREN